MTAQEARYIAENHEQDWYKNELQNVMDQISSAANSGKTVVHLERSLTGETLEALENLGFFVYCEVTVKW